MQSQREPNARLFLESWVNYLHVPNQYQNLGNSFGDMTSKQQCIQDWIFCSICTLHLYCFVIIIFLLYYFHSLIIILLLSFDHAWFFVKYQYNKKKEISFLLRIPISISSRNISFHLTIPKANFKF